MQGRRPPPCDAGGRKLRSAPTTSAGCGLSRLGTEANPTHRPRAQGRQAEDTASRARSSLEPCLSRWVRAKQETSRLAMERAVMSKGRLSAPPVSSQWETPQWLPLPTAGSVGPHWRGLGLFKAAPGQGTWLGRGLFKEHSGPAVLDPRGQDALGWQLSLEAALAPCFCETVCLMAVGSVHTCRAWQQMLLPLPNLAGRRVSGGRGPRALTWHQADWNSGPKPQMTEGQLMGRADPRPAGAGLWSPRKESLTSIG